MVNMLRMRTPYRGGRACLFHHNTTTRGDTRKCQSGHGHIHISYSPGGVCRNHSVSIVIFTSTVRMHVVSILTIISVSGLKLGPGHVFVQIISKYKYDLT